MLSFLYSPTPTSIHDHWKNHSLDYMDFVGKVISLLFNMLSKLVITFLPRSKHLLISWLVEAYEFRVPYRDLLSTYANGYYGAWSGWTVSISVLPLTEPIFS